MCGYETERPLWRTTVFTLTCVFHHINQWDSVVNIIGHRVNVILIVDLSLTVYKQKVESTKHISVY